MVRLRRTNLPAADLFATVRHFERNGYEVEWFYDEVIGLLPGAGEDPAESLRAMRPSDASARAGVALYVISYNSPEQFGLWLKSAERANPEILEGATRVLLDNSNDASTRLGYDELCERFGFTPIRHGNLGITAGRLFCAKHFDAVADGEAMLWFEDDMLLQPPQAGLCRNGLRAHVPRLAEVARAIVRREDLDFVKLSFSEFFGDHHLNWAWYNVGGRDARAALSRRNVSHPYRSLGRRVGCVLPGRRGALFQLAGADDPARQFEALPGGRPARGARGVSTWRAASSSSAAMRCAPACSSPRRSSTAGATTTRQTNAASSEDDRLH